MWISVGGRVHHHVPPPPGEQRLPPGGDDAREPTGRGAGRGRRCLLARVHAGAHAGGVAAGARLQERAGCSTRGPAGSDSKRRPPLLVTGCCERRATTRPRSSGLWVLWGRAATKQSSLGERPWGANLRWVGWWASCGQVSFRLCTAAQQATAATQPLLAVKGGTPPLPAPVPAAAQLPAICQGCGRRGPRPGRRLGALFNQDGESPQQWRQHCV